SSAARPARSDDRRGGQNPHKFRLPSRVAAHRARVKNFCLGDGAIKSRTIQSAADGFNFGQFGHVLSIAYGVKNIPHGSNPCPSTICAHLKYRANRERRADRARVAEYRAKESSARPIRHGGCYRQGPIVRSTLWPRIFLRILPDQHSLTS